MSALWEGHLGAIGHASSPLPTWELVGLSNYLSQGQAWINSCARAASKGQPAADATAAGAVRSKSAAVHLRAKRTDIKGVPFRVGLRALVETVLRAIPVPGHEPLDTHEEVGLGELVAHCLGILAPVRRDDERLFVTRAEAKTVVRERPHPGGGFLGGDEGFEALGGRRFAGLGEPRDQQQVEVGVFEGGCDLEGLAEIGGGQVELPLELVGSPAVPLPITIFRVQLDGLGIERDGCVIVVSVLGDVAEDILRFG
jgi:hypothetical protein